MKAIIWGLIVGALLYSGLTRLVTPTPEPARVAAASAPVADTGLREIVTTHFGCVTPELYRDARALLGDEPAFLKFMQRHYSRCERFDKGETVIVTDVGITSGLIKLRKPGSPQGYWTWIQVVN